MEKMLKRAAYGTAKGGLHMETEVQMTKLAKCAGCGAKVGAGVLTRLLKDFPTRYDENLIVGYDKSDDASVYRISDTLALVQTTDFFPPIVDDPFLYGQIAAANALSDVYAMGGEPKLALNVMCITDTMRKETVQDILRGGYTKAYEAGAIITGGHTISGAEPVYGLAVSGFVHPDRVLTNAAAREGDVLILTKPLGVGILTTAAKADMVAEPVLKRIYEQMATLNKEARDCMVRYEVHSCTDVTGFGLLGHSYEMAQGSGMTIHLETQRIPYHREAYEAAQMGLIPAGAYRNREYAENGVTIKGDIPLAIQDILYDPQTSGGLLIAAAQKDAEKLLQELKERIPVAEIIGYVTAREEKELVLQ